MKRCEKGSFLNYPFIREVIFNSYKVSALQTIFISARLFHTITFAPVYVLSVVKTASEPSYGLIIVSTRFSPLYNAKITIPPFGAILTGLTVNVFLSPETAVSVCLTNITSAFFSSEFCFAIVMLFHSSSVPSNIRCGGLHSPKMRFSVFP